MCLCFSVCSFFHFAYLPTSHNSFCVYLMSERLHSQLVGLLKLINFFERDNGHTGKKCFTSISYLSISWLFQFLWSMIINLYLMRNKHEKEEIQEKGISTISGLLAILIEELTIQWIFPLNSVFKVMRFVDNGKCWRGRNQNDHYAPAYIMIIRKYYGNGDI